MEKNNGNSASQTTNDVPLEFYNLHNIPADVKLVYERILQARKARKESCENDGLLKVKLEENQNRLGALDTNKLDEVKQNARKRCQLEHETYQREAFTKELEKIRTVATTVGNYCVKGEGVMAQCIESKEKTRQANVQRFQQFDDDYSNLDEVLVTKDNDELAMSTALETQRGVYKENQIIGEDQCLRAEESLTAAKEELNKLKLDFEQATLVNEEMLVKISTAQNHHTELKNVLENKRKLSDELLKEMSDHQQAFEDSQNQMLNSLETTRDKLHKSNITSSNIERGIQVQAEHNQNLLAKTVAKKKQIDDLELENKSSSALLKDNTTKFVNEKEQLQNRIDSTRQEVESVKGIICADSRSSYESEMVSVENIKTNKKMKMQIIQVEDETMQLQNKRELQLIQITNAEQLISEASRQLEEIRAKLQECQKDKEIFEIDSSKEVTQKTATSDALNLEINQIQHQNEEARQTVAKKMNAIKKDFDVTTEQQTKDFEEKKAKAEEDILKKKNELREVKQLQLVRLEKLTQLRNECEKITLDINTRKANLSEYSVNPIPTTSSTSSAHPLPAPILPPPKAEKRRFFDELSGSSAEGYTVTNSQIMEYRRRQQMKQQQKQSKKKKKQKQ